jgi:DNA polymerase elongation subunit (family B)
VITVTEFVQYLKFKGEESVGAVHHVFPEAQSRSISRRFYDKLTDVEIRNAKAKNYNLEMQQLFRQYKEYKKRMATEQMERVAILDIETNNLQADFGKVLCYRIYDLQTKKIIGSEIKHEDWYNNRGDKQLMLDFMEHAKGYDRFVMHYGSRFDMPYLRTRAILRWHLKFPDYGTWFVTDTWKILRNYYKLSRNSQQAACNIAEIECKKHPLNAKIWDEIGTGNPKFFNKAMKYICVHCDEDVTSLAKLYNMIKGTVRMTKTGA